MNSKMFKPTMLALAGAVALASVGVAQAQIADPILYEGETRLTLVNFGIESECTLYLVGTANMNTGAVVVEAASTDSDETGTQTCDNLVLGGFPWTGTLSNTAGAGNVTLNGIVVTVPGLVNCSGSVTANYPAPTPASYPAGYPSTPPVFVVPFQVFDATNGCAIESLPAGIMPDIDRKIPAP